MTATPLTPKRLLTSILAVLLPVVIGLAALSLLETGRSKEAEREIKNVGKILNGKVLDMGTADFIEQRLNQFEPEVVILGNSLSTTDILPALLAHRLGLGKNQVQTFGIPKSMGPHWFAVTRNRIYANGHKPKIILILSDLQSALAVTPRSEASYLNLSEQLTDHEPLIDQKLGVRNYYVERIRQNRGAVRDYSLNRWRNASINLFRYGLLSPEILEPDEAALDRVFDDKNIDMSLHHSVIPTFQKQRKLAPIFDPETLPLPRESFIPEITRLAAKNEGVALFVRPPMSPSLPEHIGDIVLPGIPEKVKTIVEKHGGSYMDMRSLPMNDSHFLNADHMNPMGSRRFTEALAMLIKDEDLLKKKTPDNPQRNLEIEMLAAVELVDAALVNKTPNVQFALAPPPVPRANRPVSPGTGRRAAQASFETSSFDGITDGLTAEFTPFASRCSPMRVTENGQILNRNNVSCNEVHARMNGRVCHREGHIFFSASDRTNPLDNGRSYALTLDPERSCEGALWLYPGDEVLIPLTLDGLEAFKKGARILRLNSRTMLGPKDDPGEVNIKLVVNGEQRLGANVGVQKLQGAPWRFILNPLLASSTEHAHVVLSNPSDSFILVTSVALREYRPLNKQEKKPKPSDDASENAPESVESPPEPVESLPEPVEPPPEPLEAP